MATSMDPQLATPFNKVPLEVLLRISSHLTTPELGNLRLTCKSLEQALFNTFMKEFFTKRQFMLTEDSLQALVDISKSRLSDCLNHVIIGLNNFVRPYHLPPGDDVRRNRHHDIMADHATLVSSGQDIAMLTEAFKNLKNLDTVGIRDYHSRERNRRDGHAVCWSSYGSTTIYNETGFDTIASPCKEPYANKVLITLFTALGNAGARPRAFEWLRKQQGVPSDDGFNLFTRYLKPKVAPVLESIETLFLVVNVANGTAARVTSDPTEPGERRCDYRLRHFLAYFCNLKHLRINFHSVPNSPGDGVDRFITWLGSPILNSDAHSTSKTPSPATSSALAVPNAASATDSSFPPPPPLVTFPHLEEINFGFVTVDPGRLLEVAQKFAPTLKNLELWRVTLVSRLSQEGFEQYKINLWAKTLKALCQVPGLNLEHIKIGLPGQRSSIHNLKGWFHPKGEPNERLWVQEYTGIDWKHYVKELSTRVKMEQPSETRLWIDNGSSEDDSETDSDDLDSMEGGSYYPEDVLDVLDLEEMLLHQI